MTAASIALNRFGLGARPGDAPVGDAREWLAAQLGRYAPRPAPIAAAPTTAGAAQVLAVSLDERMSTRGLEEAARKARQREIAIPIRDSSYASIDARVAAAYSTATPFAERLVHFWSNHFAVSTDKRMLSALAGPYEFEAIRPHVTGRFADLLRAVERHPAMLLYLDQAASIGPGSAIGARTGGRRGLNENLARETLELHTLGVGGGYTQADVTELARALTGRTVTGLVRVPGAGRAGTPGEFLVVDALHEPGARTVLGRRYAEGTDQADAILGDLARHPATARHIATKLARHFAGDPPPPAMVDRLAAAFVKSEGDLPTVYRALIASPEAWVERPVRFRSPWEWTIASARALGLSEAERGTSQLLLQLGQPVWRPGQPSGWEDRDAAWAGSDALMRRVEAAQRFATRAREVDARALARTLYPGAVSAATEAAIARAEGPGQGVALLLVAPETMRR